MMKMSFKLCIAAILIFVFTNLFGQVTQGKITYERKTNLLKKFKDAEWKDWLKEQNSKTKSDFFELYFNDTASAFVPQESELKEKMSWATSKNSVYQNFNKNSRMTIKDIWGEKVFVRDTLQKRTWKITDSKRTIAGYDCRKAIWQANDSVKIYAWYTDGIIASTGPESFNGLPGMILGLALEDGSVVYFAKTVELTTPATASITYPKIKDKVYTSAELKIKMQKDFGKDRWGKELIKETFGYW